MHSCELNKRAMKFEKGESNMKIIKYGKEFPAISDYDVLIKLEAFCNEVDLIETSSFLLVEGVRAMINKGRIKSNEVEFHFTDVQEIRKCDEKGRMENHPHVYGADVYDLFLDALIGL